MTASLPASSRSDCDSRRHAAVHQRPSGRSRPPRIDGHLARDPSSGRAFLQYWFFYYWNNKAFLGFGLHEGDWEMVQIGLGDDGKPQTMVFAQHDHAERCAWSDVKRDGERPQVFVARGSQASYPRPGRHKAPLVPDQADGKGATISP